MTRNRLAAAALSAALLGVLGAPARAQSIEGAWRSNSERFDGIFSGPGGSRATAAERPGLFMDLKREGEKNGRSFDDQPVPIVQDKPKPTGERDPWADRQDFGIASIGVFGLALLGVQSFFKDVFWLTVVATALVCCYFLLSAPIF